MHETISGFSVYDRRGADYPVADIFREVQAQLLDGHRPSPTGREHDIDVGQRP